MLVPSARGASLEDAPPGGRTSGSRAIETSDQEIALTAAESLGMNALGIGM